jgi:adenine-specific DNA-methyltransferase
MASLDFKGKQFVATHHYSVPFRELTIDPKKSLPPKGQAPALDDNLIIHGDNLEALKALLPRYAGKIKCIYIDPPYNTGNEGWAYNDNLRAPFIKDWLGKTVGSDDLERHDKWLCMMMPRLILLRELLAEDGVIFVSLDDNEGATLKVLMDELFGEINFVANFIWNHRKSSQNDIDVSLSHNYTFCYAKRREIFKLNSLAIDDSKFSNPDKDPRGDWAADPMDAPGIRENLTYPVLNPNTGEKYFPPSGRHWRFTKDKYEQALQENRIVFGKTGKSKPQFKRFKSEAEEKGTNIFTIWDDVETATEGTKEIMELFEDRKVFDTPKPVSLIERILELATTPNSIVLDSFAGSGTTAHAVLSLNKRDGGNRKFILVEVEGYADKITAERVRRVISGVPTTSDETLREGLGGSFTFCELGQPISIDGLLKGTALPDYATLASYVFYTATGATLQKPPRKPATDFLIAEHNGQRIHLIYKPDKKFLRSNEAMLNSDRAETIATSTPAGSRALVFAAGKFMSQNELAAQRIEFSQLPYTLHRVFGG